MSARSIANCLSKQQRDHLIDHIAGPQPIQIGPNSQVIHALMVRNLIRPVHKFDPTHAKFPHHTGSTELGREVICIILGDYADNLVRAGVLECAPPIKLLRNAPVITPLFEGREAELSSAWSAELSDH